MGLIKIKLYFTFIFLSISSGVICQQFSGVLKYKYDKILDTNKFKPIDFLGEDKTTDYIIVTINQEELLAESFDISGNKKESSYQIGNSAEVIFSTFSRDFDSLYPDGIKYEYIKKLDNEKSILGEICTAYLYQWGDTEVTVWIPKEGYKYDQSFAYDNFFNRYFLKEGLVFAYQYYYKSHNGTESISYWELIEIEER